MTGFHRNQAAGPIKQPLSAVTEAAGKHSQNQVPVRALSHVGEQFVLMADSKCCSWFCLSHMSVSLSLRHAENKGKHQYINAVLSNCVCSALLLIAKLGWDFLASNLSSGWHLIYCPGWAPACGPRDPYGACRAAGGNCF